MTRQLRDALYSCEQRKPKTGKVLILRE